VCDEVNCETNILEKWLTHLVSGFAAVSLHSDIAAANFSRPIRFKMAQKNSRGTATSAIYCPAKRRGLTFFERFPIFKRIVYGGGGEP
jgi:hypothetical protein